MGNPGSHAWLPSMPTIIVSCAVGLAAYAAYGYAGAYGNSLSGRQEFQLPPQSVFIDPKSFAVLNQNGTFRDNAFTTVFNPTSTSPPFFQIFDPEFLSILGPSPSIHAIAENATFAFAHEAPIYVPEIDDIFFTSNDGGPLGMSDINRNNMYFKLNLAATESALAANLSVVNVPITPLNLSNDIQMTNGGTGPYKSSLILVNSGRGPLPPSIALVNPNSPNNSTILLDNYYGRQFNSLNDVKVHPVSGKIYFTDTIYGFLNNFRPTPLLPSQVYVFDPQTFAVKIAADGFDKSNGVAFSGDGKTAYIADTGSSQGFLGNNQTHPATIYAFGVDLESGAFINRRAFAYADAGVPDGVQVDSKGNVYSGCGDGVHVWNSAGTLLGKFFLNTTSANMVFAGDGRLVIMAETKVFLAHIAAKGINLGGPD